MATTLREVIASKAAQPKDRTVTVYISDGRREEAHSTMQIEPSQIAAVLWALRADRENAYVCCGMDGWMSNVHMHGQPPAHLQDEVDCIRSARNYCPDCFRHKPNLTGPCGNCGAGN
jgi:hypothetical protein